MYFRIFAFSAYVLAALAQQNPIVDLGYARYQGSFSTEANTTHFFGVRYAAPPTGSLRWSAPQQPAVQSNIQMALEHPPSCPQSPPGSQPASPLTNLDARADLSPTEDCLFLDVYVPGQFANNNATSLPVLVWIHGGGYIFGDAALYSGDDIIRESNGQVIFVAIQYRLGLFGFLAGEKVKQGGVLNAGLLDQQFALQWVQKHITKFGGNPNRVTIWGQSCGGASVLQHVIANNGRTNPPLFHNAMSSSTYLVPQYDYNARIPETLYREIVSQANCSSFADSLSCLRNADTAVLQTVSINISGSQFFGTVAFAPVVDGTFIAQRPSVALKQRKTNGKGVLLAVTNTLEGSIFVNESIVNSMSLTSFISNAYPTLSPALAQTAAGLYSGLGNRVDQAIAVMSESIFLCPTYTFLRAFPDRAFKAEFALPPARHIDDIAYYFPSMNGSVAPPGIPPAPIYNNTDFQRAFSQAFMDVVVNNNVNRKIEDDITPDWSHWSDAQMIEMVFNKTEQDIPLIRPVKTSSDLMRRCQFWDSVGATIGQ